MGDTSFRCFNYGRTFDMRNLAINVRRKIVDTNGQFLICFASPEMIQRFENHPYTVAVDGTHGTNASKFMLISVNIVDSRGEGSPIFQSLVETENQIVFSVALNMLKSLAPVACLQAQVLFDDEELKFHHNGKEIEEKAKKVREIMASKTIPKEVKKKLHQDLENISMGQITFQGMNNPPSFPGLDRKRSHSLQNRSFFPVKKSSVDYNYQAS
ncbi:uncharacterized protein LOC131892448 [Tigriopus californicus]|uniref:uncharacterized protein LOC131892448 n=1 Tax=Tigriopus californicus TaxID=6832 RepID=UPI0027D9EF72|nr:uncharacterized protein LOC131892448 [Tigriopus californicus]